jgi:hypothetical protein
VKACEAVCLRSNIEVLSMKQNGWIFRVVISSLDKSYHLNGVAMDALNPLTYP